MFCSKISLKIALTALLVAVAPGGLLGQSAPTNEAPSRQKGAGKLRPPLMTSKLPREQEERQLLAILQSADKSEHAKVVACHRLAVFGTEAAVPTLAALLTDPKLSDMARYALEPMAYPAAAAALRDALGKVQGVLLIGVINSIGARRDREATPALVALLERADDATAAAVAVALGKMGTTEAARHLQHALDGGPGARRNAFVEASLTCAGRLATDRQWSEATAIYDRLSGAGFPDHIRMAAMCGAIISRQDNGIPLLLQQLRSQDPVMLNSAWRSARLLPGTTVTQALAAELATLPAEHQCLLLQVFAARGDQAALPVVLKAAGSRAPTVRLAAIRALPRVDDGSSSLALLLQLAGAGRSAAESTAALASLSQIRGAQTDATILAALPSAGAALRPKLIEVLGARRAESARGQLLALAADADPAVRKAAFRALALVARPADLTGLIQLAAACRDDAVKVPADLAVFAVSMKIEPAEKRADPLLAAYATASDAATKCSLLRPLGAVAKATGGSPPMLDTIKQAFRDKDPEVRAAALRVLVAWPDASPAPFLLEIIRQDPTHRALALRGGVQMVANVASGRDPTKLDYLAWFTQANQAVRTNEEKLIIVSGLGSLKQIEGLQMLQPYLDDPAVQTEAALAVIAIAPALATSSHAATVKAALEKIAGATRDADVRRQASEAAAAIGSKTRD